MYWDAEAFLDCGDLEFQKAKPRNLVCGLNEAAAAA
jgi:hypothetical protein